MFAKILDSFIENQKSILLCQYNYETLLYLHLKQKVQHNSAVILEFSYQQSKYFCFYFALTFAQCNAHCNFFK